MDQQHENDGPAVPVETRIWHLMSGNERAEVMDAVGTKGMSTTKALRACAAYIKKNLDKYKPILKRAEESRVESMLVLAEDVSDVIAQQMGGAGRIKAMLGGSVMAISKGLAIKWPSKERSKGNYAEVTLRPDDTYDMEFFNVSGAKKKSVKKYEMIYADGLISTFEKQTGMYLKL